jgi:hypothetical protein
MSIKNFWILSALALAGCASAPELHSGGPGTSEVVNGMELWKGGPPPRPYGVITTVQRAGADQTASFADEEKGIAADAAQRGADAVIVLDEVMVVSRMDLADSRPILAPKVDAELIKYR